MVKEIKNVVLAGASGNLGPAVLKELLDSPFNITVLSRPESKSAFPEKANVVRTSFDVESLTKVFQSVSADAVICTLGGASLSIQIALIDAAIAAGVQRFIPSEFGSDTSDERVRTVVPIFDSKHQVIEYLVSKQSQISWTGLLSGPFIDWGLRVGFLGFNLREQKARIWDSGNVACSVTTLATVGQAVVKVLQHAEETKNRYVRFASFTTSQGEVLAALEKLTGKKWEVEEVDSRVLLPSATQRLRDGNFASAIPDLIMTCSYGEGVAGLGNLSDLRKMGDGLWNEKLGLPEETLEDTLKALLKEEGM